MRYFPAFLNLADRPVLVAGDGELARRKCRLLSAAGAKLTIFAGAGGDGTEMPVGAVVLDRDIEAADFDPRPALLVVATDDDAVAAAAIALAREAGVTVNAVDRPDDCDVVVPSIVDRGDVVIGISTGGAAPVLGRRLRARIEALLPARLGDLVRFAGARRDTVAGRVEPAARRAFWERIFAGPVADAVLDGDEVAAAEGFDRALAEAGVPEGSVHIVGAGPGDPELLTLKALRVLQEADIVLYDNLVSSDVLDLARRDAVRRYVGKRRADHSMAQEEIGELMISLAQSGQRVVRLKGGDPYIFGRGGEEVAQLAAAGIDAHVIPGITAAAGCAAAATVPLTLRGQAQAVTYVTAQAGRGGAPDLDWQALATLRHTLVIYMGVSRAGEVAGELLRAGRGAMTPVAIVENGTLPTQRIVRTHLGDMARDLSRAGIAGPAVLIIGEVAAMADGRGLVALAEDGVLAA